MASQEHINEQLKVLLSEDLKVISYKWLARKFGLPCNLAKQTLFAFLEQHRGKVKATYLLAGWTTTEPRQHTVQLVDSEHLSTRRSALNPVTSMHVYSLQPTQPKDAAELWNHDAIQTSELFQELRLGKTNCLADNRWSAVKCLEAKHDPSLARRAPKPAATPSTDGAAAGPSKLMQKPVPTSAAGQIAGIMAGSAKQAGVATATVAVKGSGSSSVQDSAEAVPVERDSGTTAIAPSGAAPLSGPNSGGPSPAAPLGGRSRKGGKSRLANMWSKAPAVKDKPLQAATSKTQPAPAVDADAALRTAQQAGSSSDSEEEELLPMKRHAQQRSKRIEEEEEEETLPVRPAGRQTKKARTSGGGRAVAPTKARQPALEESEDDEEEAAAQPADSPRSPVAVKPKGKAAAPNKKKTTAATGKLPARKPAATKSAAKAIQSDEEMSDADIEVSIDEDQQQHEATGEPELTQGRKGKKGGKRAAAASKPGLVKAGGAADIRSAGPKRRKVMRTTINDRGEEVNEEVWEDSQEASPSEEQEDEAAVAQPQASAARSPAGKSPEKASQDDALKEQPGKPAAAKPTKASGPNAKRGAGRAATKDQRGIMSFFAKK